MSDEALNLTEGEWATGSEPYRMLDYLRARTSGNIDRRRARLFACTCCREVWHLLDERSRRAIEVAERYADGFASAEELAAAGAEASALARSLRKAPFKDAAYAASGASAGDPAVWMASTSMTNYVPEALAKEAIKKASARETHREATRARQAALIRDLFGNPFRPVTLEPSCKAPALVALAQAAYDERTLPGGTLDPARIAVLADALEDAGTGRELLEHLRGPGPHARGCWAVDAVLGREVSLPEPEAPPPVSQVVPAENEYAPCFGGQGDDGNFSLGFSDFDGTAAVFEEMGYDGGGYAWHGVVDALVRMRAPKLRRKLRYDPEGSMFAVISKDREAIRQVADLIRAVVNDEALLREAIENADPDLIEG